MCGIQVKEGSGRNDFHSSAGIKTDTVRKDQVKQMNDTYPVEIFQSEDGRVQLEVQLKEETVWLTQKQLGILFERERSVITKHINNIFKEGELTRDLVFANFAHTAGDGKTYQTQCFNLDVIISVGYRVKSQRGVQFRQWATQTLKQHLIQGYTLSKNSCGAFTIPCQ